MKKFNHLADIGFTLLSDSEENPTQNEILVALRRRIAMLQSNPEEITEAIGLSDTVDNDITDEDFVKPLSEVNYSTDTTCTGNHVADRINSRVLEWADDIAEKLTELECKLNGITCYVETMEGETTVVSYTEEAQDIFNIYYDEQVDSLYKLINESIKIHQNGQ